MGWVSPIEEEGEPLVDTLNVYMMICLQFEEKILALFYSQSEISTQDVVNKFSISRATGKDG